MKRSLKNAYKGLLVKLFHLLQRMKVDLLPRHFYSEIPAIYQLRETQHWRQPYSMTTVPGGDDLDAQLQFVRETVGSEISQALGEKNIHQLACQRNGEVGYGHIEAEFLYAFVRRHNPGRIVQVGCGVSTAVCLEAASDVGYQPKIICIEPYPTDFLSSLAQDSSIELIQKPIEVLEYDLLNELASGDLFFVDSTHTLGPAGEVTRIITEMLPRLADGVYVHFHDIWFPYDFSPDLLDKALFFWHESALLHAFLCLNKRFKIQTSLSMLHNSSPAELQQIMKHYQPMQSEHGICTVAGDYPSSIYLLAGADSTEGS